MKRTIAMVLTLMMVLALVPVLGMNTAEAAFADRTIEVTNQPAKTLYYPNEALAIADLKMNAYYLDSGDSSEKTVALTHESTGVVYKIGNAVIDFSKALSTYTTSVSGTTAITMIYTTKDSQNKDVVCSGTFYIRIRNEYVTEIAEANPMKNKAFYAGEQLDLDGLALSLLYTTKLNNTKTRSVALSDVQYTLSGVATTEKFASSALPKLTTVGKYELNVYYTDADTGRTIEALKLCEFDVKAAATAVKVEPATNEFEIDGSSVKFGSTIQLTATSTFGTSDTSTDPLLVSWGSSHPEVATVDATGLVTAVGYGNATITVRTRGSLIEATATVTVSKAGIYVTGIQVNKSTLALNVGDSETLAATLAPTNTTDTEVTWSSNKPAVATVDSKTGKVTAVGAGTAVITASVSSSDAKVTTPYTATCTVTVTEIPVQLITVTPTSVTLNEGTSYTLTGTIRPYNATNLDITWISENDALATVKDGVVTAKSITWTNVNKGGGAKWTAADVAAGRCYTTVKIFAYSQKDSIIDPGIDPAVCVVTIKQATLVTQIQLNKAAHELTVGGTAQLYVTYVPTNATTKAVTWTSENPEVATVSSTGKITGVGSGQTIIWATANDSSNGAKAKCVVSVNSVPTESIGLNALQLKMYIGQTATLVPTVFPSNATNKGVIYTSSKESVVTVSEEGLITAVGNGKATITVTAKDGSPATASCGVTVTQQVAVTKITLSATDLQLLVGDTTVVTAMVTPDYASEDEVTWTSSNPNVVGIDENGKVSGYVAGQSATITATAKDGSGVYATMDVSVVSTFYGSGKVVNCLRRVNVREKASGQSKFMGFAYLNSTYKVLGKTGNWYKISFEGKSCYIWSAYLRLVGDGTAEYTSAGKATTPTTTTGTTGGTTGTTGTPTKCTVTNCVYAVNVRSGPGTNYDKVGIAALNSSYAYLGTYGDWYKLQFNSTTVAYIHSNYIAVS